MSTLNFGFISDSSNSVDGFSVTAFDPTDVFGFGVAGGSTINVSLNNISFGDDADLRLYRDNGNGVLDAGDTLVESSLNFSNQDDVIEYFAEEGGTYFAEVERYAFGSVGSAFYDLDVSVASTYELGLLSETPSSVADFSVTAFDPTDVYEFDVAGGSTIHLNLHNISVGDDADLRLYQDNGNGFFDLGDTFVASSANFSNGDDLIDYYASQGGTYFAEVERYAFGSFGDVSYDLDVSATASISRASNLVGGEVELGQLSGTTHRFGTLSESDTVESYGFSLSSFSGVNISLNGLTADADIRLIEDGNGNGIVDAGEVIGSSVQGGSQSEFLSGFYSAGDYVLQVYQFGNANTSYDLTVTQF